MLGGVLLLRLAEGKEKKVSKGRGEWVEDEDCARSHGLPEP